MSENTIEERLLKNDFLMKLRTDLIVDREVYDELCSLLRKLAVDWKGKHLVRKDVAEQLYGLAAVTLNVAERFRDHDPAFYSQVLEMSIELDALVLEVFHSSDA